MGAQLKVRNYVMNIIYRHPGEFIKIPSYNELGPKLGIAKSTVQLALKQLIEEGFLVSKVGVGTFTNPKHSVERKYINRLSVGIITGDGKIFFHSYYNVLMYGGLSKALAYRCIEVQPIMLESYDSSSIRKEILSLGLDAILWRRPPLKHYDMLVKLAKEIPLLVVDESFEKLHCVFSSSGENGSVVGQKLLDAGRTQVAVSPCIVDNKAKFQALSKVFSDAGYAINKDFVFKDFASFSDRLEGVLKENKVPDSFLFNPEETDIIYALLKKYNINLPNQCLPVCFFFKLHGCDMPMYVQQYDFDTYAEKAIEHLISIKNNLKLSPKTIVVDIMKKCDLK